MDVNQFFELVQKCSPAVALIGTAIGGYFWIQKTRAETRKFDAEALAALAIQNNNQAQLESLRKGETGDRPSQTPSKHEFPKLLKPDWTTTANIGVALLALIVFFVDLFSSPLTAYVLANMMFLLFAALLNLLILGFQVFQRQEENNFRIQNWISIEGQLINLELTKIQHAANVELTKTTLDLIARAGDEIIEQIKKLRESPGNHPNQTTNPVKPE